MKDFDLNFVRSQFYAFDGDNPLSQKAFFENAGGSFPCKFVVDKLTKFYETTKVQPYGYFNGSIEAGEEMDQSIEKLAQLLRIPTKNLHVGPSTSQNTYVLANALRLSKIRRKAIIVSNQDHESNTGVWRNLANQGFEIREWGVRPDGILYLDDLKQLVDSSVCMIAFPHVSNIIGQVNPVKEICTLAKEAGAFTCVDGVSYAPHGIPQINDFNPDIYLFSSYKTFGPHLGVMYVSDNLASELESQCHYFNTEFPNKRFTPAGPDHAQVSALGGMYDYFEAFSNHHLDEKLLLDSSINGVNNLISSQEKKILKPLLDFLKTKKEVRLLGSYEVEDRVPTVAIVIKNSNIALAKELNELDISIGVGDFYAVRLLEALDVDTHEGVVRLSFVHYTSGSDVEKLISGLDRHL
ncbi:MAG: aminotransferase class V-fold PLP-dependent enzyme [Paracoccaceae bacterium]